MWPTRGLATCQGVVNGQRAWLVVRGRVFVNMAALTVDAVLSRSKAESIESVRSLQCWAMKLDDVSFIK